MTNLKEVINSAVQRFPECSAFTIKHKNGKEVSYEKVSYKRFGDEINYLGTALIDLGLKNKRIAIIGKNRYEWMLSYCAVLNGTGIVVPLDKGLPEQEIISSLERSKADAVIYEESYSEIMENAKKNNYVVAKHYIKMEELKTLIERGKQLVYNGDLRFVDAEIDSNAMSVILFTSGTTALAKAVMLSHYNIVSNIEAMNHTYKFYPTDVNIAFLPLHHTFGCTGMLLCLSNGVNNVFCDGLRYIQENMKEYKVTVFIPVHLILEAMHKKIIQGIKKKGKTKTVEFGRKISKFLLRFNIDIRRKIFKEIIDELGGGLRFVFSGAAALNEEACRDFNDFGIKVMHGYGLTETSPVVSGGLPDLPIPGSSGHLLDNVQVKIDEPNEQGIGEVVVKGPNVMLGYYEDEKATNEVIKNGWFYTGDLGYFGEHNYLYIVGRKKSMIGLKNGKKIYPEELEVLLDKLPYVAESMVFGYPKNDDVVVSAKIVYNKAYIDEAYPNISKEQLEKNIWKDIKQINSGLTSYKHIKKIFVTDEPMIKTTTAKVKRFAEIDKILKEEKNEK